MDFGLSQEISDDIVEKAHLITKISKSLENHFREQHFGDGIETFTIGIICVRPEFDFFFKEQRKYTKSKKMLEYDVKIDHELFKHATETEVHRLIASSVIDSLYIILELKIQGFDVSRFKAELESFFANYSSY